MSFFLLDDLVNDDLSVKFFMPFDDFRPPAVPNDVGAYREYRRRSIEFIEARNHRIKHLDFSDRAAGTAQEETAPSSRPDTMCTMLITCQRLVPAVTSVADRPLGGGTPTADKAAPPSL